MGELLDEAINHGSTRRAAHPKGWEPHVVETGSTATAVSEPLEGDPSEADLIRGWDMDPDLWEIVGEVQVRRWQAHGAEGEGVRWFRYFKANLRRRSYTDRADVADLCKRAARVRPAKKPTPKGADWCSFVALNDWQIGKGEGGGTPATVDFLLERFAMLDDLWRETKPPMIHLGGVGDLGEAVSGHYPGQLHTVDLDQREQDRTVRELKYAIFKTAVRRSPVVVGSAVPCNHGQNRNGDGKMQTKVSDNKSLTYLECVQEAFSMNPEAFGHVTFEYANESGTLVTDLAGIPTALNHGHEFSGTAAVGAPQTWWNGQIVGMQPAAAAMVLITAHRHHTSVTEESGRTIFLAPACDGGSGWFTRKTGKSSPRGMLTVSIGIGIGDPLKDQRCWDDLRIL